VWPSSFLQRLGSPIRLQIGTPKFYMYFAAQYPTYVSPCQRFEDGIAPVHA